MDGIRSLFRRQWHLIAFVAGLALFLWAVWTFRSVVLPFILGVLLAYLLLPVGRAVEKRLPGRSLNSSGHRS